MPVAGLFCYVLLAGVAYAQVGHWPVYGQPDPGQMGRWSVALGGIALCFLAAPLGLIAVACSIGWDIASADRGGPRRTAWRRGARDFAAYAVTTLLFMVPVWLHRNWLLD